jgi:multiple sugar transport system ATP-binding protein
VLGIRPEQFERRPAGKAKSGTFTGAVTLVEPLGSDLYVTIDCGGKAVTARLDPEVNVALGEPLSLRPALQAPHLFDGSDGRRIE